MAEKQNTVADVMSVEKKKHLRSQIIFFAAYIGLFVLCNVITGGRFFRTVNFTSILTHAVYYGVVGFGMVFIMTPGIIDMSIGATVLLASNVGAVLAMTYGLGYPGLILGTVITATVLEVLTIYVGVKLKIPAWIAGLSMAMIYEAILTMYSNHLTQTIGSATIQLQGYNYWGRIPGILIIWFAAFAVCYLLFNYTTIGINVRALGNNPQVAEAMGISRFKTLMIAAAIGGCFVGFGALAIMSMNGRMAPAAGMTSISQIFKSLAVFLLATSFANILGVPFAILLGSLFIAGLFNFMTLMGVPSGTGQEIMLGVIVIICGVVSKLGFKGVVK